LYRAQNRFGEAEPLYIRSIAIREKALGPDHPQVGTALNHLGELLRDQGRYSEAEPLFERLVSMYEKAYGPDDKLVGITLDNLGFIYKAQGKFSDAERLYKRAISITEKTLGPDDPEVATVVNNLANLLRSEGRFADVEPLYTRALSVFEKKFGSEHSSVSVSLNNLASFYEAQGRYVEAESLYKRALAIRLKTDGPDHREVGTILNNLAGLLRTQDRFAEAEPLYKRALAVSEKSLGPNHPAIGMLLSNIAMMYLDLGRYADAGPLFKRDLEISEETLGPDHPIVSQSLENMAQPQFEQQDWSGAVDYGRRSTALITRGTLRSVGSTAVTSSVDEGNGFNQRFSFLRLIKAAYLLSTERRADRAALAREMFQIAQWSQNSAAANALAQMAARGTKGDAALAALVRERQDLVAEWRVKDELLIAAKSEEANKRNNALENALTDRLGAIDTRLAAIDARLAEDFHNYSVLVSPLPLPVTEVQAELRDDEALVLFLDTPEVKPTPEETFIWVVTKKDIRWVRSELGTSALQREVAALRCGLDGSIWDSDGAQRCAKAIGLPLEKLSKAGERPFDLARAHALYKGLFGEVEDLIKDKHLLVVVSGALNALPLQVLVTGRLVEAFASTEDGYAKVAWLGTRNALTVLPAVSSLQALRAHAKTSRASDPFIGFGNPLLTGPDGTDRRAWEHQHCPALSMVGRVRATQNWVSPSLAVLLRRGFADVEELRRQVSLPETADELCAVARARGIADPDEVVNLGERATVARVKGLSADGTLARARVVHFATHGLVAGETASFTKNRAEPALLFTPPERASEQDDGLLTASEVATLKLDADWVILSACNTAAGDSVGGDALSGLARAFFYAGARALLVSHWYVDSEATVALVTRSFDALRADPKIGRAEALRRAMTALVKVGGRTAHPANWAPFVVVGEGGAVR
jgi:CHAT domain-containing protein/Tfp pilus assembly protein PilF